jgi:hypothetical protein
MLQHAFIMQVYVFCKDNNVYSSCHCHLEAIVVCLFMLFFILFLFLCCFKFMFKFVMGVAANSMLSGVEPLLEDVTGAMQNFNGTLSPINDEDFGDRLNEQATANTKVAYLLIFVQSLFLSYQFG